MGGILLVSGGQGFRRRLSLYGGILYYLFGVAVIYINISIAIDTPPSFFVEQSKRKCNFGAARLPENYVYLGKIVTRRSICIIWNRVFVLK